MRRWILAVAMTALAGTSVPMVASAATGKDVFAAEGCAKCHKVTSEGIAAKEDKPTIVELSGTGKGHDVAFFKAWLQKENEMDSKVTPGTKVKHKYKFKGTPADLDIIAGWLKTLTK